MTPGPLGLYIHVPFCVRRCHYCNFYSTTCLEHRDAFVRAVEAALSSPAAPGRGRALSTVYFGGGTPSLLGEGICAILEAVRAAYHLPPAAEVTLEANPGGFSREILPLWRAAGVNRLSLGLQSGSDRELETLGRIHTFEEGSRAVEDARAAGFENVSADLLLATPGQTAEEADQVAALFAVLPVTHISAYLLKIEDGTPFGRNNTADLCPDEDETADIYLTAARRLEGAGFSHYEISNFARPGFESRHNTLYWTLGEYVGLGPGAHSFYGGRRFFFPPDLDAFLTAPRPWALAVDDGPGGDWEEFVMLSLRMRPGLSLRKAAAYGRNPAVLVEKARPLAEGGLVTLDGAHITLTDRGFLLSNSIIATLLEDDHEH